MTGKDMTLSARTTRRRFLVGAGATAGILGSGAFVVGRTGGDAAPSSPGESPSATGPSGQSVAAKPVGRSVPTGRTLVVINLDGGNDGLATVEPLQNSYLQRVRPELLHDPETLVLFDEEVGLNPGLAALANRPIAIVEGVGHHDLSLSHFDMASRWATGAMGSGERPATGFLGRLCDELDVGAPLTGLSIGRRGRSPALFAEKARTAGVINTDAGWFLRETEDPWLAQLRESVAASGQLGAESVVFADTLGRAADQQGGGAEYPGGQLGEALQTTARLLRSDAGVRVVEVTFGGFDTHSNQAGDHDYLLEQFGTAVEAFLADLSTDGLNESVLVATTSEFGRRPASSDYGTDHGGASCALLFGPVDSGRYGETPSLRRLDDYDNLAATVAMTEYYATLADWFGIHPSLVLAENPKPIPGILTR